MSPRIKAMALRYFFGYFLPTLLVASLPFLVLAWLCSRWSPLSPGGRDRLRGVAPILVWLITCFESSLLPRVTPPPIEGTAIMTLSIAFGTAFSLALARKGRGLAGLFGALCLAVYSSIILLMIALNLQALFSRSSLG